MKTAPQTRAEIMLLTRLIEDIPVAVLTAVKADGALASRPVALLEMDDHGAFWSYTDARTAKLEYLRAMHLGFTGPAQGTYVSASGEGQIVTDRGRIERLWTPMARPWFPDGPGSPSLALLKFVPEAATCWDAPNSSMARVFDLTPSAPADQPVAMGRHAPPPAMSTPA